MKLLTTIRDVVFLACAMAWVGVFVQWLWLKWKNRLRPCLKCSNKGYLTYHGEVVTDWCSCKLGQRLRYLGPRFDNDPGYDKEAYLKSLSRRERKAFLEIERRS